MNNCGSSLFKNIGKICSTLKQHTDLNTGICDIPIREFRKSTGLTHRAYNEAMKHLRAIQRIENHYPSERASRFFKVGKDFFEVFINEYQKEEERRQEIQAEFVSHKLQSLPDPLQIQSSLDETQALIDQTVQSQKYSEISFRVSDTSLVTPEMLQEAERDYMPKGSSPLCRKQREELQRSLHHLLEKGETYDRIKKALNWKKNQMEKERSFCAPATFLEGGGYSSFRSSYLPSPPPSFSEEPVKIAIPAAPDPYIEALTKKSVEIAEDIRKNPNKYQAHPRVFELKFSELYLYIQNNLIDKSELLEKTSPPPLQKRITQDDDAKVNPDSPFPLSEILKNILSKRGH